MIELLTVHTYIQYEVLESYEEHHVAVLLCTGLFAMSADAERFDAKTTVLIENVTHYIQEEEEDEQFPRVRTGLGREQLSELGARLLEANDDAPRSPAQPSALKKTIDAVIKSSNQRDSGVRARRHSPVCVRTGRGAGGRQPASMTSTAMCRILRLAL